MTSAQEKKITIEYLKKLSEIDPESDDFFKRTNRLARLKELLLEKKVKNDLRFN